MTKLEELKAARADARAAARDAHDAAWDAYEAADAARLEELKAAYWAACVAYHAELKKQEKQND